MDTFYEQIVSIKKSGLKIFLFLLVWLLAFLATAALILTWILRSFTLLVIAGVLYGAYKLTSLMNIEYEYIVTNGTMDIDKITNKSSRKRLMTFELSGVTRIEKYNPNLLKNADSGAITIACNENDPDAYFFVCEKEGCSATYAVFSPNERMKEAIVKFVPRFVANSAFKE